MKKHFTLFVIAMVLVTSFGLRPSPVHAYAYDTRFESIIHIQNVGEDIATITLDVYSSTGSLTTYPVSSLPVMGSTSLYVGSLGVTLGFKGSAVINSDQPLATVISQSSQGAVKNQPLSSGFSEGGSTVLIPTVLKKMFNVHSLFSVQNVDTMAADLTFTFVPLVGNPPVADTPIVFTKTNLSPNVAFFVDMNTFEEITEPTFNGSVFVEAVRTGTTTPGSIVGSSMELEYAGNNAYGFDGALATANKIYLPTAQCKYGPGKNETTSYAVSNPNDFPVDVKVTFSTGVVSGPYTLAPFGKISVDGCVKGLNPKGYLGSAIAETLSGDNIHVVSKIYGSALYPAHLAFVSGSNNVALPFVRWAKDNWKNGVSYRTYIAIQNIGSSSIAAGEIVVKYYDKDGVLLGVEELGAVEVGGKLNSHPGKIGTIGFEDGEAGARSAIVEGPAGSQLAVVVRVQKYVNATTEVGEDYTAIPIN